VVCWLVKIAIKNKMGEGFREENDRLVEFTAKSKLCESRWKFVDAAIK
jgi:hypothetical protein